MVLVLLLGASSLLGGLGGVGILAHYIDKTLVLWVQSYHTNTVKPFPEWNKLYRGNVILLI